MSPPPGNAPHSYPSESLRRRYWLAVPLATTDQMPLSILGKPVDAEVSSSVPPASLSINPSASVSYTDDGIPASGPTGASPGILAKAGRESAHNVSSTDKNFLMSSPSLHFGKIS